MILSASSAGFANRTPQDRARYLAERVAPITEQGLTIAEYTPRLLKTMMAPTSPGPLVDRVVEVISAMRAETFLASMKAITAYDSRPALRTLTVPTLLVAGEHDPGCPPAGMRHMAELVPDAAYVEIEDAGHYAFAEQPDVFHETTTAFIRRIQKIHA
ncbi:alpha/beta fold hydrolase [Streptomyces sp. NPDC059894]|uniref:alpha/beta fold hydrolase n=1 Tax=Streptomyces sp. NPDC059894 TaxID=3346991 RepID=UPI00366841D6